MDKVGDILDSMSKSGFGSHYDAVDLSEPELDRWVEWLEQFPSNLIEKDLPQATKRNIAINLANLYHHNREGFIRLAEEGE